jgi:hypothetical protein
VESDDEVWTLFVLAAEGPHRHDYNNAALRHFSPNLIKEHQGVLDT